MPKIREFFSYWFLGKQRRQINRAIRSRLVMLLVAITLSSGIQGCAKAIVAKTNTSHAASYDGNERNSGIVAISKDSNGKINGRVVTQHFLDRYNALVDLYGDQFTPPLKHGDGFNFGGEGMTCTIDEEHFVKMGQMIQWKRDGRKPTGTFQRLINKVT